MRQKGGKAGERQRSDAIRQAPDFGPAMRVAGGEHPQGVYTIDSLAIFLGAVDENKVRCSPIRVPVAEALRGAGRDDRIFWTNSLQENPCPS